MEHIGEILRTAREDNFYTQKKVMELTGINRKTLSGYENSVAEPDLDTFARLLSRCERKMLTLFQKFDTSHQEELLIQFQSLADYLDKKSK